jgi:putative ABC transport system permease protein
LIAAIAPAIGAGRVSPVAAMSDTAFERTGPMRGRVIGAAACATIGAGTIVAVLLGATGLLLGVGSLCCSPRAAAGTRHGEADREVAGAPVQRLRGVTGAMARGNVQRNPKRTARTAAPVLIGVALVTGASVFAASIKVQLRQTIGSTFVGDYVINTSNGVRSASARASSISLNTIPEVGTATGLGFVADRRRDRRAGRWREPSTRRLPQDC